MTDRVTVDQQTYQRADQKLDENLASISDALGLTPIDRNQSETSSIIPQNPRALIVVCGATATGKSGLGMTIARQLNSLIVSADSRQIYREFDIGSAKVMPHEMQGVPHYLVDAYDPTETVSAAMFQDRARQILSQAEIPLLVGGTGLYIRSITHGMRIPRVVQHPELRSQLEGLGQSFCYQLLQHLDPKTCLKVHANDRIRTVRALEVFYVTGIPMSVQQGEEPPNYPILQIGLRSERLDDRIALRTRQMFELGFVNEVKGLVEKYGDGLPLLNTLGYQEVRQYLRGEITLEEAEVLTVLHTRQFAKRQKTWFNGIKSIEWFDADAVDLVPQVLGRMTEFCRDHFIN
jgi:tRNA dimethylallyltransferase